MKKLLDAFASLKVAVVLLVLLLLGLGAAGVGRVLARIEADAQQPHRGADVVGQRAEPRLSSAGVPQLPPARSERKSNSSLNWR